MDYKALIREVPNFPRPGILFYDITTLLKDAKALRAVTDELSDRYVALGIGKVVGIESRGFILGGTLATRLGAGFVPVRKPGKLPADLYEVKSSIILQPGPAALTDGIDELHRIIAAWCLRNA